MKNKKKEIRIIQKHNENYTFINDNILSVLNKNNNGNISKDNEEKSIKKINARIDKKVNSKKMDNKGRKIMGKSMQGHSPVYE